MSTNYEMLIIGAGPAGMTAGLYASRARVRVCCFERLSPGGQAALTARVENYPGIEDPISGIELCRRMEKQARSFGLEIVSQEVESVSLAGGEIVVEGGVGSLRSAALIVASGARSAELGVPGEREFFGKGVSYCATCDGPLFKDQEVAVLGGGDSALDEALFLTRFCRKVYLVHRRDEFRAVKLLVERVVGNEKIELVKHSVVERIVGSEGVEAVEVRDLNSGVVRRIAVSGVFLYVGLYPNTEFLRGAVRCDERGYVVTDEDMGTSVRGIFAAGDVRRKSLRQISTAVGDGAVAAMSAVRYLENREPRQA
ncbi:MAG: thioredoxin-disulfide reductase [Candidatus Eisenbacteria bacterium]|nr:thioredoxin-disulfide reductase [Candidatus Eisenbacteria bacterium]